MGEMTIMKTPLKLLVLALLVVGVGAMAGTAPNKSSAAGEAPKVTRTIAAFSAGRSYSTPIPGHGTHLCSADSHCGTGHKCCSGHCQAVSVC